MEAYIVNWIISGVVLWSMGFLLLLKVLKLSYDLSNRIISALHAVVAIAFALMSVEDWGCPVCPLGTKPSPKQMKAMAVSLSYMIYDTVCCQFSKKFNMDTTFHHLTSTVGLAAGIFSEKCGTELVAGLFITELSSPFLHLREILKESGIKDTDLNFANDVLFAVTFTVGRMVFGPYITYLIVTANNPIVIKAMAVAVLLVSAYWFMKVLRMMKNKFMKRFTADKVTSKTS